MAHHLLLKSRWLIIVSLLAVLAATVACGADATPAPVVVEKEVPIEVIKEVPVTVEVPVEVIKEVPKEIIQQVEVIKEVPVTVIVERLLPTSTPPLPTPTPTPAPKFTGGVQGGSLRYLTVSMTEQWDPHRASNLSANAAVSPLFNQVVHYNPVNPTEIIGDLAKKWVTSEGGLVYTFQLNENVKWSDGKDLTAEDVAFSINRMIEEGQPRPRTGLLKTGLESAEVIDPSTVKVNLGFAWAAFLPLLAVDYMKVVPKHVLDAGVDINEWDNIVGSGPFVPKDLKRGASWKHEKNPNYFKAGLPFFDDVTMVEIRDAGTIVAAFRVGELDLTTTGVRLSVDDAITIQKDLKGKYTVFFTPAAASQHILANTENPRWADLRIMNALRIATKQTEIQKAIGAGTYEVGAPFPTGMWYGSTPRELAQLPGYGDLSVSPRTKADDIADAKALFKAAGFDPPSAFGKIKVQTVSALFYPDLIALWVEQMRRGLGLDMEVEFVDIPTAINMLNGGTFEDLFLWGYGMNISDPDDYVKNIYGTGTRNYTRWKNTEFHDMLDRQSREPDVNKRFAILKQMEEILRTQDPYNSLMWTRHFYTASDQIRTEAGGYVPAEQQTVLKLEHMWFGQ